MKYLHIWITIMCCHHILYTFNGLWMSDASLHPLLYYFILAHRKKKLNLILKQLNGHLFSYLKYFIISIWIKKHRAIYLSMKNHNYSLSNIKLMLETFYKCFFWLLPKMKKKYNVSNLYDPKALKILICNFERKCFML